MDGLAVKPLTVDFHEGGFLDKLNQESKLGFWSQLSDDEKKQAGSPWGPSNPQALNRYSYVQNNPLKWTDPTGHWTFTFAIGAEVFAGQGVRGNLAISIDTEGTISGSFSVGASSHVNYGGSFGPTIGVTNAPTVFDLEGGSVSPLGVNLGEVIDIGAELTTFKSNGTQYYGVTGGSSATIVALPVDVYSAADKTVIITAVSPVKLLERAFNEGMSRLKQRSVPILYQ